MTEGVQAAACLHLVVPRPRTRRRPPDFAPSSETPGGYAGQAVLKGVVRSCDV